MTLDSLKESFSVLSQDEINQLAEYLEALLNRGRYLLGIPHQPPFLRYLNKEILITSNFDNQRN